MTPCLLAGGGGDWVKKVAMRLHRQRLNIRILRFTSFGDFELDKQGKRFRSF